MPVPLGAALQEVNAIWGVSRVPIQCKGLEGAAVPPLVQVVRVSQQTLVHPAVGDPGDRLHLRR